MEGATAIACVSACRFVSLRVKDEPSVESASCDGNGGLVVGETLTEREAEILTEVAKGLSNREIAQKLYISESTVKSRLKTIFSKLKVRARTQAAAYAIRRGYVR